MNTKAASVEAGSDAIRAVTETAFDGESATAGVYTVLEVGGEGGGYTIVADGSSPQTRFRRLASTGEEGLFDFLEDDPQPVEEERPVPWCDSLAEALQTINSAWPLMSGIFVHPAHQEEVCKLWHAQLKENGEEDSVRSHKREYWMELFGKSA